jgi:flagella basal body P-ring formation protein FlgA
MKPLIIHFTAVAALLLALAGSVRASDDSRLFTLQGDVQVDSQGVFLDQIVVEGASHVRLSDPPTVGASTVLTRSQAQELVRRKAPEFATTNWAGADKVRVSRQVRNLDEDTLTTMLADVMQRENVRDRGQLELHFARTWKPLLVPDEPLTTRILEFPAAGVSSTFSVRFELRCGQEVIGSWSMPLQARLWREILVAQGPVKRGERLQTANLGRERRDILRVRDAYMGKTDDASLELVENVAAGAPVLSAAVRIRPVVYRGKMVDAILQQGSMLITVKVQALEDGFPGQSIRVRNSVSGREFRGKVQNEDTIEVVL